MDGQPIPKGAIIAGRRVVGGGSEALSPAEINALVERITGSVPLAVRPGTQGLPLKAIGAYTKNRGYRIPEWDRPAYYALPFWEDGTIKDVVLSNKLTQKEADAALPHEGAHAIDDRIGTKKTKIGSQYFREMADLPEKQLADVYADLNGGMTPQQRGYSELKTPGEKNAEALRAYLVNPDYIKSVAPYLAAALRKAVNNNPRLNGILHLNSFILAAGLGASKAYTDVQGSAADDASLGLRPSPFDLRGPIVPDDLLHSVLGHATHQRDAERAVLPLGRSAAAFDRAPEPSTLSASLDLDHSGVREAIHHVRTLKAELASLDTASVSVRHSGFGYSGGHAPGAVRSALNGNFGSDGRAFG